MGRLPQAAFLLRGFQAVISLFFIGGALGHVLSGAGNTVKIESATSHDEYLTKRELAQRMKVTTRTVDAWMSKGLIPYRKIGRTVRFSWDEVSAELARQRLQAKPLKQMVQLGPGLAVALRTRANQIRQAEARP